jgi:hypothetical protein
MKKPNDVPNLTKRDMEILCLIQNEGAKTAAFLSREFWLEKSQKAKAGYQRIRKLIQMGVLVKGNPKLLYPSDKIKEWLAKEQKDSGVDKEGSTPPNENSNQPSTEDSNG